MKNEWAAVGGCEKLHATNAGKKKGNENGKSTCQSVFLSIAKLKSICVLSLPKGIYSTNGISNGIAY